MSHGSSGGSDGWADESGERQEKHGFNRTDGVGGSELAQELTRCSACETRGGERDGGVAVWTGGESRVSREEEEGSRDGAGAGEQKESVREWGGKGKRR